MKPRLLIGIGNRGRGDDGLGWAFADLLKGEDNIDIIYRYQLQVEDAELMSQYEVVWFVDASHENYPEGYEYQRLEGQRQFSYTTHSLHPETVVQLCKELYQQNPKAHLIGISGTDFELGHNISETARKNLDTALHYVKLQLGLEASSPEE